MLILHKVLGANIKFESLAKGFWFDVRVYLSWFSYSLVWMRYCRAKRTIIAGLETMCIVKCIAGYGEC